MKRRAFAFGGCAITLAASCAWLSTSSAGPPPPRRLDQPPAPVALPSAAPSPAAVPVDGLVLYGVSGASGNAAAIIGSRLGGQRVVAVGRDYRPGLTLAEIGVDYAILRNGPRSVRLEISRFGAGGVARATASLPAEEEQKIEAAVLRTILQPVRSGGRVSGYALRAGESLPQLNRAGLRPGDLILSVNGSQLDEERVAELAWQMGNSQKTEFVFVRDGKKMRTSI